MTVFFCFSSIYTLDENYLTQLGVMLFSLIRSNPDCALNVYLLHSSIPENALLPTEKLLSGHGRLFPIQVRDLDLEQAPTTARYPKEIYYRIFAARYGIYQPNGGLCPRL